MIKGVCVVMEAQVNEIRAIFNNQYWFNIPSYQRPYVWGKEEIEDLLDDLIFAFENNKAQYFLGTIVLRKLLTDGYHEYEVIDGQQRLTTLFLVLAAISDLVTDPEEAQIIRGQILQYGSISLGIPQRVRIIYARGIVNDTIMSVIQSDELGNIPHIGKITDISSKNIVRAFSIAKKYIEKFLKDNSQMRLLQLTGFINTRTEIICVSADTQEDAFRLFSILNNRGIPLNNADILKAENIGALTNAGAHEIQRATQDWERVENKFEDDDFDNFLQFIRAIYLPEKAEESLLEEFRKKIYDRGLLQRGNETISVITGYYDIYEKIIECGGISDNLSEHSNRYRQLTYIMRRAIKSKDWIPPILYFYKKFSTGNDRQDFEFLFKFLKRLEFKFSSDWICGEKPTQRRNAMYNIIKAIRKAECADDVINNEKLFLISTDKLSTILNENIYGENYANFILLKLESLFLGNNEYMEYNQISIEHVLPQTVKKDSRWRLAFTEEEENKWKHRLANLVLLSRRGNTKMSNYDFDRKKREYYTQNAMGSFQTTRYAIENSNEWTPRVLEKRQKMLIEFFINNRPGCRNDIIATVNVE